MQQTLNFMLNLIFLSQSFKYWTFLEIFNAQTSDKIYQPRRRHINRANVQALVMREQIFTQSQEVFRDFTVKIKTNIIL
ncbi:hypothetical protein BV508_31095 [Mycobacterium intermedium]|nr:hypothetical protein BV508_31095 [Mycobacterium intermedium]